MSFSAPFSTVRSCLFCTKTNNKNCLHIITKASFLVGSLQESFLLFGGGHIFFRDTKNDIIGSMLIGPEGGGGGGGQPQVATTTSVITRKVSFFCRTKLCKFRSESFQRLFGESEFFLLFCWFSTSSDTTLDGKSASVMRSNFNFI